MKALRGLHYVKRQPTGCVHARARVCVCVRVQECVWKNWQRGGETHRPQSSCTNNHNHKEWGGGEKRGWAMAGARAVCKAAERGGSGCLWGAPGTPCSLFPSGRALRWCRRWVPSHLTAGPPSLSPHHTSAWMNEFLAAPRCTTVPNGYQVSVTLLFLLLMPLFLSPLCVYVLTAESECVCTRVHVCMYVCERRSQRAVCAVLSTGLPSKSTIWDIRFQGRLNLESMLVAAAAPFCLGDLKADSVTSCCRDASFLFPSTGWLLFSLFSPMHALYLSCSGFAKAAFSIVWNNRWANLIVFFSFHFPHPSSFSLYAYCLPHPPPPKGQLLLS